MSDLCSRQKGSNFCVRSTPLRVRVCNAQLFKAEQESKARLGMRSRCGLICRVAGPSQHVQHTSYTSSKRRTMVGLCFTCV